jgi:hypothetical protein
MFGLTAIVSSICNELITSGCLALTSHSLLAMVYVAHSVHATLRSSATESSPMLGMELHPNSLVIEGSVMSIVLRFVVQD